MFKPNSVYTVTFPLLICQGFDSLPSIISYVLYHLNKFYFFYITFTYLWMFLMIFLWYIQKDFGSLLRSFGQGDLTNFEVSISHLCWVCRDQMFWTVSFEIILRQKYFPRESVFGFTNYLLYSLEESKKLRMLISWVLILPSKLIAIEDVPVKYLEPFLYSIQFKCRRACEQKIQV